MLTQEEIDARAPLQGRGIPISLTGDTMLAQDEIDGLDGLYALGAVSVTVRPKFYVRWTRWMERHMLEGMEALYPSPECRRRINNVVLIQLADDETIIRERLGDSYLYCGVKIRLEEPEYHLPADASYEVRFTY